jgi:hypothetical protein
MGNGLKIKFHSKTLSKVPMATKYLWQAYAKTCGNPGSIKG